MKKSILHLEEDGDMWNWDPRDGPDRKGMPIGYAEDILQVKPWENRVHPEILSGDPHNPPAPPDWKVSYADSAAQFQEVPPAYVAGHPSVLGSRNIDITTSQPMSWEPALLDSTVRTFQSGATRSDDTDKLDYRGFLSPFVLRRFAQYMHQHRVQADGTLRAADNWKKGIPPKSYKESLIRHVIEFWLLDETDECNTDAMEDAMCAIIFNAQGWLHTMTKED